MKISRLVKQTKNRDATDELPIKFSVSSSARSVARPMALRAVWTSIKSWNIETKNCCEWLIVNWLIKCWREMLFILQLHFRWWSEIGWSQTESLRQRVCATQFRLYISFLVCWFIGGAIFGFVLLFRILGSNGESQWFGSASAQTQYCAAPLSVESFAHSCVSVRRCFLAAVCQTRPDAHTPVQRLP